MKEVYRTIYCSSIDEKIIGEEVIDTKTKGNKSQENKNKTISDTISFIKLQMNDNTNISSDTIKKSK